MKDLATLANKVSFVENLKRKTTAMRDETYQLEIDDSLMIFEFTSEGPKGLIKKRVQYQNIGNDIYNLAFGDVDIKTDEFDDKIVSNNSDTKKVLATVAATINIFVDINPKARIYAKGSTFARTRLYRIGISNNLEEINKRFEIYGMIEGKGWVFYEKNNDYSAFIMKLKD